MTPAQFQTWRWRILTVLLFAAPLFYIEPQVVGIALMDSFNFPKQHLLSLASLAIFLLFAFELILFRRLSIAWGRCASILSLLTIWAAVSVAYCPLFHAGLREAARWAVLGVIFLCAMSDATSPRRVGGLIASSVSAALVVSAIALAQFMGLDLSFFKGGTHRVYATMGNPNFVASYLALTLPAGYWGWCALRSGGRGAALLLTFSCTGTAALLVTGSRAGIASLSIGMISAASAVRPRGDGRRALILLIAIAAIITLLHLPSPLRIHTPGAVGKMAELAGPPRGGTGWRLMVWRVSAEMLRSRPLSGWGAGSYPLLYLDHAAPFLRRPGSEKYAHVSEGGIDHAHNEYLETWIELGLPGLALFILFLILLLRGARRGCRSTEPPDWIVPAMFAGCIALLADAAVAYPFHLAQNAAAFFAFAGALSAPDAGRVTLRVERTGSRIALAIGAAAFTWLCLSSMAEGMVFEIHLWRGIEAFERGDTDASMREMTVALGRRPRDGRARFFKGLCLAREKRYAEAIVEMRAALETYPRQMIYLELGKTYEAVGDAPSAERFLEAATSMVPRDFEAWNARGAFLFGRGDAKGAAACFRRAVALKPDSFDAARNLGVACQAAGVGDEALRAYERALELNPDAVDIHVNMGAIYAMRGDAARARERWEKALAIEPGNRKAQENLKRIRTAQ